MKTVTALLMFRSSFVEESQYLLWAHLEKLVFAIGPDCQGG